MNTPAQCGAIKPPKTDIYSEAPQSARLDANLVRDWMPGPGRESLDWQDQLLEAGFGREVHWISEMPGGGGSGSTSGRIRRLT